MSFDFTCPFCKQVMQCDDAWAGLAAKCPSCGRDILMNPPTPEPAKVDLSQYMPHREEPEPQADNYTPPAYYAAQSGGLSLWERLKKWWKIVVVPGIILVAIIGYPLGWFDVSQEEVMSTSKQLVTKILLEKLEVDYVELVEIRNLKKIDHDKWEGQAYVSVRVDGIVEKGTFDMTWTRKNATDGIHKYEDYVEINNFRDE